MDTSFTNSRESLERANRVPESHWTSLTRGQQFRSIELEGFVVVPVDLLSEELVEEIREETSRAPHHGGRLQRASAIILVRRAVDRLTPRHLGHCSAGHGGVPGRALGSDELICTSCTYCRIQAGPPGNLLSHRCPALREQDVRSPDQLALSGPSPLLPGRPDSGVLPLQGDSTLPPVAAQRRQPWATTATFPTTMS